MTSDAGRSRHSNRPAAKSVGATIGQLSSADQPTAGPAQRSIPALMAGHDVATSEPLPQLTPSGAASAGLVYRLLTVENRQLAARLRHLEAELAALQLALTRATSDALTDPLTGLANRRAFDEALAKTAAHAGQASPTQLLIADIDRFKVLNDRHGHHFGDGVLCITGAVLKAAVRRGTLVARVGGDEFALLLPAQRTLDAATIAERLCDRIAERPLAVRGQPACAERVTLSIGVAGCRPGDTAADWYARADAALYTAKRDGRNRVALAPS